MVDSDKRNARKPRGGPGPTRRQGGVKLEEIASRHVRAGHPWVFREALFREPPDVEEGSCVPILDDRGHALAWGLWETEGAIALRVLSRQERFSWNHAVVHERVELAEHYRKHHAEPELGSRRVAHGEADGLPGVAVDKYGDYLVVYRYARSARAWTDALVAALEKVHQPKGIYVQDRFRAVSADQRRGPAELVAGEVAPTDLAADEDGLTMLVDPSAPVSPGLFLDLREGRRHAERIAAGRRVLNLFSFTGAFALRAVRAGAETVTNVDAAARSHARCRQNLAASGLDPESCEAITGDVFKVLEKARQRERVWDLVVVDPPPYSRVKSSSFSALKDWRELMRAVAQVCAPDARVLAVSNAVGLAESDFLAALDAGALEAGRRARTRWTGGLPPDFPGLPAFGEGHYLKVFELVV